MDDPICTHKLAPSRTFAYFRPSPPPCYPSSLEIPWFTQPCLYPCPVHFPLTVHSPVSGYLSFSPYFCSGSSPIGIVILPFHSLLFSYF